MYENILIPTDGSKGAEGGVEHGLRIARRYDATVHTLFVVEPVYPTADFEDFTTNWNTIKEAFRDQGERVTEEVADRVDEHGLKAVTSVQEGSPHGVILDYADENDIDLIAMGTHGRTGLRRYLMGSVTERVIRSSEVPVLAAKAPKEDDRKGDYNNVLIPTDGSRGVERAIEHGLNIADEFDANLHALYVIDTDIVNWSTLLDTFSEEGEVATKEIEKRAASFNMGTTTEVVEGTPHEEILDYIKKKNIDLVVMGTHGRSGLDRLFIGSVTSKVVRSSEVPVLTVRMVED
ncbi:MAG: universal stress protein [Halobacteria archaeon]|nr:universal stress protein [Halobacteria archaeon]